MTDLKLVNFYFYEFLVRSPVTIQPFKYERVRMLKGKNIVLIFHICEDIEDFAFTSTNYFISFQSFDSYPEVANWEQINH